MFWEMVVVILFVCFLFFCSGKYSHTPTHTLIQVPHHQRCKQGLISSCFCGREVPHHWATSGLARQWSLFPLFIGVVQGIRTWDYPISTSDQSFVQHMEPACFKHLQLSISPYLKSQKHLTQTNGAGMTQCNDQYSYYISSGRLVTLGHFKDFP